jgi:hypothetical protein
MLNPESEICLMIRRNDLEAKRSPLDMKDLLRCFAEDRETYRSEDVHLRRGIVKDLLEEYSPLCTLATNVAGVLSARLTPPSSDGPDAVVELESAQGVEELTVQITVANQSYQQALARERLSQGLPVLDNTEKYRVPENPNEIGERGRVLTTKEERLRRKVAEVVAAVQKKINKYHERTDILLVGSRIKLADSCSTYSWRDDLIGRIDEFNDIPYRSICLANGDDELLTLYESM